MHETPIPSVLAMLVADQVIIDEQTKKKSLIGVFDNLNALEFPALLTCAVYAKLADAEGHYDFQLRMVNLKDESLLHEVQFEGDVRTQQDPAELAIHFVGVPVPEAGKYEFQLYANGMYLTRITMQARKISNPGAQPWQQR